MSASRLSEIQKDLTLSNVLLYSMEFNQNGIISSQISSQILAGMCDVMIPWFSKNRVSFNPITRHTLSSGKQQHMLINKKKKNPFLLRNLILSMWKYKGHKICVQGLAVASLDGVVPLKLSVVYVSV